MSYDLNLDLLYNFNMELSVLSQIYRYDILVLRIPFQVLTSFDDEIYVNIYFLIIFSFFSYSLKAKDCNITLSEQKNLIKSSLYSIEKIDCINQNIKWFISNKKFLFSLSNLKKKSQYYVEDVVKVDDNFKWTISNSPFVQKKNSNSRKIASTDELRLKDRNKQSLVFSLNLGVASIESVDVVSNNEESVVSDLGYRFAIKWAHLLTDKINYYAEFRLNKNDYRGREALVLADSTMVNGEIVSGINYKVNEKISSGLKLGLTESVLLMSNLDDELSLYKLVVPDLSLETNLSLYRFSSGYNLTLNLNLGLILPTSEGGFTVKEGNFYNIGLGTNYNVGGTKLFINWIYGSREIKVDNARQRSKNLGLTMGAGWSF